MKKDAIMDTSTENTIAPEAVENTEKSPKKSRKNKKDKTLSPMHYPQKFLFHLLVIIVVVWVMFGLVFGLTTVPSNDMYPRMDGGDLLLYYRLERAPKAQDIVVLDKLDTTYVGRVVAKQGDTVDITDDEKLVINGNSVIESNIFYGTPRFEGFNQYPVKLNENEYFVLVDQRQSGEDSRYYGVVKENEIEGTVITVIRRSNL